MKHLESKIQRAIVRAVKIYYPKSLLFSVPNGGFRRKVEAAIMKAEGVTAGVSDLVLLHKGKVVFVEVKSEKGKPTEYQNEFKTFVESQGHEYWLVRSAEETLKLIETI